MANQLIPALPRATDANGDPVSGAKALFYQTGTTTPVTTYTDEALSVAHSSPVVADASGKFAQVFIGAGTQVKVVVNDADDALLYQYDPCPMVQGTSSAAESVTFNPVTGVASDNVQDAIEEVQGNITAVSANVQTLVQTGGSGGAYTLTAAETITAYAAGQRFLIRPNHTNSGAATLNVDGLGAKNIKVYNAAGTLVDPAAGDLGANRLCEVTYDGTRFILFPGVSADMLADTGSTTKVPCVDAVEDYVTGLVPSAWVAFDGTGTPSIIAGKNVSSITDGGVGIYTVNFTNPMANTNYAAFGSGNSAQVRVGGSRTVNGVGVVNEGDTGTNVDAAYITVVVYGGLS